MIYFAATFLVTIVLHNVCGLDSDVMVTKNVDAC